MAIRGRLEADNIRGFAVQTIKGLDVTEIVLNDEATSFRLSLTREMAVDLAVAIYRAHIEPGQRITAMQIREARKTK